MPKYRIFCKSWYRRTNGTFEDAKKAHITDDTLYEKTADGEIKQYGCGSSTGYELETPTELPLLTPIRKNGVLDKSASTYYLPHCDRCNCPQNGSPRIEAELEEEANDHVDIDWSFDYYGVLRLALNCSKDDIKKRYNEYTLKFHSDKYATKSAEEQRANQNRFTDIGKAYEMLINDAARLRYKSNETYRYMPFQCPGCVTGGITRQTGIKSTSSMRWFHSPQCGKGWNKAQGYDKINVHGWTDDGGGNQNNNNKPKDKLPLKECAGCKQQKPFHASFWHRWSESSGADFSHTPQCLFDYWTGRGAYPDGSPPAQCYYCGAVKKENNPTKWMKIIEEGHKLKGKYFCSQDHMKAQVKKTETGLGGQGGGNFDQARQDFILELVGLDGWDALSTTEQNNFTTKVNSSMPDRFPAIKAEVLVAISQKRGGGDPLLAEKNAAIAEIDGELLLDPEITNAELEVGNQNWGDDIQNAKKGDQIKQIKDKVLADIRQKRQVKKSGGGGGGSNLEQLRQTAINQIRAELNQDPAVNESQLTNQNWETEIRQATSENAINEIRDRVLADIRAKRVVQAEQATITNLLAQAKQANNWNNYQNLAGILAQIKKLRSSQAYQAQETEIQALENQLRELDPNKFKETTANSLDQQIKDNGLTESNMDEETKQALATAKADPTKENIDQAEEKIAQNGANNKLNNLITQTQNKLQKGNLSEKEKAKAITEILQFIAKNNYQIMAYQKQKRKVDKLLAELWGEKSQDNTQNPSFWKKALAPLLIISLLGVMITGVLIWRRKRLKRKSGWK